MFDVMLTFFVLLGICGLLIAADGARRRGFFWFGLAIGFGVLAKGPVILLHLLPVALLAPWWKPGLPLKKWYPGILLGVLGGTAIALAWAIPAAIQGGEEYRRMIFWGQTANRMVNLVCPQACLLVVPAVAANFAFPMDYLAKIVAGSAGRSQARTGWPAAFLSGVAGADIYLFLAAQRQTGPLPRPAISGIRPLCGALDPSGRTWRCVAAGSACRRHRHCDALSFPGDFAARHAEGLGALAMVAGCRLAGGGGCLTWAGAQPWSAHARASHSRRGALYFLLGTAFRQPVAKVRYAPHRHGNPQTAG